MNLINSIQNKVSNVTRQIIGPKFEKTIDPRYKEASAQYKKISIETEHIIGYLIQMNKKLSNLAMATSKFGNDINHWFLDAPEDQQLKGKTTQSFAIHFSNLTLNFLGPRVDANVIKTLSQYQIEVSKLAEVRINLKEARKEYDKANSTLNFLVFNNDDSKKIAEYNIKMNKAKNTYQELNEDFILRVRKLIETRPDTLEKPFKNLVCILSQYMMQVFQELQKFKTLFPDNVFCQKVDSKPDEDEEF